MIHFKSKYIKYLLVVVAIVSLNVKTLLAAAPPKITTVENRYKGVPVIPFQDTIFTIYGNVGAVSVEQRAIFITQNIQDLNENGQFKADSLTVDAKDGEWDILYKGKVVMSINDQMAKILALPKETVAEVYKNAIVQAVNKEKQQSSWLYILKRLGLTLLIFGITYYLLKGINLLFRKIRIFVQRQKNRTFKPLYNIVDADQQISFGLTLLRFIKFGLFVIVIYLCFSTLFSVYPATKGISDMLLGYITSPLRKALKVVKDFIPDLFSIIVIVVLFHFLRKIIKTLAKKIQDGSMTIKGFYPDWAMPTYNIINFILYILTLVSIWGYLPMSKSPAFQGISVFMGIMFSLGSTSVIGNMVSGLVITYMRPFKIGDRIQMGEYVGDVIEKTPLVTRVKTVKNEIITIPNSNVMSSQTINYTNSAQEYGLVLHSTVTIGYDVAWDTVHKALLEAAENTPNVMKTPNPFVLQTSLDDFYVAYQINVYTKHAEKMPRIYSDLHQNIQDSCARAGFEILSPHYTAMRDGADVAIPASYLTRETSRTSPFSLKVKIEKPVDDN